MNLFALFVSSFGITLALKNDVTVTSAGEFEFIQHVSSHSSLSPEQSKEEFTHNDEEASFKDEGAEVAAGTMTSAATCGTQEWNIYIKATCSRVGHKYCDSVEDKCCKLGECCESREADVKKLSLPDFSHLKCLPKNCDLEKCCTVDEVLPECTGKLKICAGCTGKCCAVDEEVADRMAVAGATVNAGAMTYAAKCGTTKWNDHIKAKCSKVAEAWGLRSGIAGCGKIEESKSAGAYVQGCKEVIARPCLPVEDKCCKRGECCEMAGRGKSFCRPKNYHKSGGPPAGIVRPVQLQMARVALPPVEPEPPGTFSHQGFVPKERKEGSKTRLQAVREAIKYGLEGGFVSEEFPNREFVSIRQMIWNGIAEVGKTSKSEEFRKEFRKRQAVELIEQIFIGMDSGPSGGEPVPAILHSKMKEVLLKLEKGSNPEEKDLDTNGFDEKKDLTRSRKLAQEIEKIGCYQLVGDPAWPKEWSEEITPFKKCIMKKDDDVQGQCEKTDCAKTACTFQECMDFQAQDWDFLEQTQLKCGKTCPKMPNGKPQTHDSIFAKVQRAVNFFAEDKELMPDQTEKVMQETSELVIEEEEEKIEDRD